MQTDPDYRSNQRDAQRAWQARNPEYWRHYRKTHPDYVERNRNQQQQRSATGESVKMDVSALPSGLYHIRIVKAATPSDGSWTVEITPICLNCPCKNDVCKDRT